MQLATSRNAFRCWFKGWDGILRKSPSFIFAFVYSSHVSFWTELSGFVKRWLERQRIGIEVYSLEGKKR